MSNKSAQELAEDITQPGKFSFIDRLRGRNYPEDDVTIYLDEALGYEVIKLRDRLNGDDFTKAETRPAEVRKIDKRLAELQKQLEASRYTITMRGVSSEDWDAVVEDAAEQFPYEYEEVTNPFTGAKTKEVIQTPERTEYFTRAIWLKFFQSITDSEGNVDDDINEATVAVFRETAPMSAITRVSALIDKLRMATDWVEYIEDEDFLAKP